MVSRLFRLPAADFVHVWLRRDFVRDWYGNFFSGASVEVLLAFSLTSSNNVDHRKRRVFRGGGKYVGVTMSSLH
jgi:hypothetical protein